MSPRTRDRSTPKFRAQAPLFAALGDETRLSLVEKLSTGARLSISRLADGSALTRQAITKHLRVLQRAGLVRGVREGRESRFELLGQRLDDARHILELVSRQWDSALARLKAFVESEPAAER